MLANDPVNSALEKVQTKLSNLELNTVHSLELNLQSSAFTTIRPSFAATESLKSIGVKKGSYKLPKTDELKSEIAYKYLQELIVNFDDDMTLNKLSEPNLIIKPILTDIFIRYKLLLWFIVKKSIKLNLN